MGGGGVCVWGGGYQVTSRVGGWLGPTISDGHVRQGLAEFLVDEFWQVSTNF